MRSVSDVSNNAVFFCDILAAVILRNPLNSAEGSHSNLLTCLSFGIEYDVARPVVYVLRR
ncbi:hypothetical protein ANAPH1_00550 [Anaplasma phagocytophilum]|nr:hypothetical protein ANAPH1_00550 [Anaplasma phagocytophilum]SCV65218.1 hypothetical protein ANAPH2_01194 [Anaplasma phagocytophilum]